MIKKELSDKNKQINQIRKENKESFNKIDSNQKLNNHSMNLNIKTKSLSKEKDKDKEHEKKNLKNNNLNNRFNNPIKSSYGK